MKVHMLIGKHYQNGWLMEGPLLQHNCIPVATATACSKARPSNTAESNSFSLVRVLLFEVIRNQKVTFISSY